MSLSSNAPPGKTHKPPANMSALLRLSMSVSIPLSVSRNRTTVLAGLALGTFVTGILLFAQGY
jgi:hypothetical protein